MATTKGTQDVSTVELGTLQVGETFICPWRPEGRNVGLVVDIGSSGSSVRFRDIEDGTLTESYWSKATAVLPSTREEYTAQAVIATERNRSNCDSPVQRVHEICNSMKKEPRDKIIAKCLEEGINISTAKTQYYAWRKIQR